MSHRERSMRLLLALFLAAPLAAATSTGASDQAATAWVIHVNEGAAPGGNGSAQSPFKNLPRALEKAKATSGAVVIQVAPGTYFINSSLVIDRPLVLRGSSVLVHGPSGLPTGGVEPGTATRILGGGAADPAFKVGREDGEVIKGVTIRGFVFKDTATHITLTRVQEFLIAGNVFRAPSRFGVDSTASSGGLIGNYFSGLAVGAVLAGGYPASPAKVTFKGNRSVGNDVGGLLLNGSSVFIEEFGDQLVADVQGNDLSRNGIYGVRFFIIFRPPGGPGDMQETGHIRARIRGNTLRENANGFLLDAGFPYRELEGGICDPRIFSGSIDLTLENNKLAGNLERDSWLLFTRFGEQNPETLAAWQYLHASRFTITDPQHSFGFVNYDNPRRDPHKGSCPGDEVREPLGNVIEYNGVELPKGTNYQP
jgi:uncharacterized protein DUF1565